jgi:hypothetical protein
MPKFRDLEQLINLFLMLKSREDDMKILLEGPQNMQLNITLINQHLSYFCR